MDSRYVSYKKSHVTFFLLVSTSSLPLPCNKIFATLKWLCRDIGNSFHFYLYIYIFFYMFTSYPQNIDEAQCWTQKIPTGKNFGSTKYPREKSFNPRNTHEKKFRTHEIPTRTDFGPTKAQWYNSLRPMRPTMAQHPPNLAQSQKSKLNYNFLSFLI